MSVCSRRASPEPRSYSQGTAVDPTLLTIGSAAASAMLATWPGPHARSSHRTFDMRRLERHSVWFGVYAAAEHPRSPPLSPRKRGERVARSAGRGGTWPAAGSRLT
jgi:hypothetical protein